MLKSTSYIPIMTDVTAGNTTRAGRREWIGLSVLALPCMLLAMDMTVLNLAVPALSVQLRPSGVQLLWIVDIYGFLIAGCLITMGTLGDRIGRRRLLLVGAAAFGAASVVAAFSKSAGMLIATRALMGVAGATLMPSTLALIRNMFHDSRQRTIAIAAWLNSFMVGGALGPLLGGVMLEHFWWGSVFLLNVPVMALLLVLGPLLLPENRDPNAGRLDLISAGLSLVAMLSIIFGIKQIAQDGLGLLAAVSIIVGVGLAVVFVVRQRALADPLIDLRLFKVPAFSASICTQLVALMAMSGVFLFIAQYMQLVLGLSPLRAGLWMLPWTVGGMSASMFTPWIARRIRPSYVIGAGLTLSGLGMLVLTGVGGGAGLRVLVTAFVLISTGLNLTMTMTTDLIMGVAPADRAGAASAISETSCELGLALGTAILGSVGIAWYRRVMAGDVLSGIPSDAAAAARSTLGGAVDVAEKLGSELGALTVATARNAFGESLALMAAISAAMMLTTAIAAVVALRSVARNPSVEKEDLSAAA
jgi:DHA2 family multidrug resistance protein-like MFS transporter